jgi:twitching motility two-component system response regulator PilH
MATKKLLLVDDDEDLVLSIQPSLEKEGWEVHTSFSAEQAKTMAVNNKPDLIVMDIIMEGEHGYSAIEELMSNPQFENVPVIVFSSLTHRWDETTATREDALLSDAAEFVDKSDGADALVRVIRKHLGT